MVITHALVLLLLVACSMPSASLSTNRLAPSRAKLQLPSLTARGAPLRVLAVSSATAEDRIQEARGGDATLSTSTFNLAKSVIGAGVLSLPSGVAFFADEPGALIPSSIICAAFGLMAAYTFSSIGNICREYDANSFQDAWAKSVSPKSAWVISSTITALCFLASLAYSIIIGDSFTSLAQTFALPAQLCVRSNVIMLMSILVLLPLCLLRNLSSLAPFSLLGLGGTLYTAVFMAIRLLDGSYTPKGQFFADLALKPVFNARGGYAFNHRLLVLLSMLSTSYIAHYNAPKFFTELQNPTMARFNTVVGSAFGAAVAFFVFIMSTGFLTFGGSTQGFVLNNYSSRDALATFARLAIGVALVTGYPFTFCALRDGLLDILHVKGERRDAWMRPLTPVLLALVTALALVLKDVGFVVSMSGAMFGCALMFVVPAIMNIKNLRRLMDLGRPQPQHASRVAGNYFLIGTGVTMGVLGVAVSVMNQMGRL